MTRSACGFAAFLLFLSLTVPVLGDNSLLHAPKPDTSEEKERYEKEDSPTGSENEPTGKENERVMKEKERVDKEKEQLAREKELVKKEKELLKREKEQIKKEKEQIRKNRILVKDGVSYREVTVQKGDTLYGISRRYSKEGSSYAETLQFNNIKDPDHIVGGDIIKVPLFSERREKKAKQLKTVKQLKSTAAALPNQQVSAKAAHKPVTAKSGIQAPQAFYNNTTFRQKASKRFKESPTIFPAKQSQTFSNNSTSGQKLFEEAIKSYRTGDCQTAIQLFAGFLNGHNTSKLAADASLFIADCYLKLSGK
ncbi:MAG: LysM peptidoglycan-binding domain-containing protein [Desulfuromonadaceae bacterium]|nr:LysM peptidoglycan-binding domain-containing protein [Desulfuromonadaceae bacterium]